MDSKAKKRDHSAKPTPDKTFAKKFVTPDEPTWGTSPGALGIVKAKSEEARHETCPECGYGGGRHARICSRSR